VTRIVDTHFHLQALERYAYPWLDPGSTPPNVFGDNFGRLRSSYRIEDYLADVSGLGVMKAVHVENGVNVADSVAETLWLQSIADQTGFPHAIVAQVPLHEPGSTEMIEAHTQAKNLRGVRHILNWHADPRLRFAPAPDLLASADWRRGFSLLERHDLSFDLQIYPHQLAEAFDLARAFPDTQIILCHLGMPIERSSDELMEWEGDAEIWASGECRSQTLRLRSRTGRLDARDDATARPQDRRNLWSRPLHVRQQFSG
jgi:predicted TIM-barrel fold metal-dependent hydrolase